MPASVWLSGAEAALRVASLNLCTDEYLLLLARPGEIVSVSHLSHDPRESTLWKQARGSPANRGSLESVIGHRPTLILTMGGSGRATEAIARRLGIRVVTLPYPGTVADVERQAATIADALGDRRRAAPILREIKRLRRSQPSALQDGAFLGGGGLTLDPSSLGADWLRLAGIKQGPAPDGRLSLESLAASPPKWLIRSDYRGAQASRGAWWLQHPLVRRLAPRTIGTDGRRWTCAGLPMIREIERIRKQLR